MNKKLTIYVIIAILIIGGLYLLQHTPQKQQQPNPIPSSTTAPATPPATEQPQNQTIGTRTKTSNCVSQNALPDKDCTPGNIIEGVTKEQICVPGYSASVRNVSDKTKNEVYAEYGITSHPTGAYEVDHHISLELGGSNDISNLWPEPAVPQPGFHEKDKVENYLHKQVCDGVVSLHDAQVEIANNWLGVYQMMLSGAN